MAGGASKPAGGAGGNATEADIRAKLKYQLGKVDKFSKEDLYRGAAWSAREKLIDAFERTQEHWRCGYCGVVVGSGGGGGNVVVLSSVFFG
jgi:hypothetical protein